MHICTRTIFASLSHTLLSTHPKLFRPATSFSFPMSHSSNSSSTNKPQHEVDTAKETGNTPRPQLTLPAPEDVAQDGHQLEVNGKDVKLDALGPVVINEDGTISRINNWAEMAEIEKENVRRILLKRNELRLKKLKAKAE